MTTIVFLAVLSAAVLHAVWNALVKGSGDKAVGMCAIVMGHLPIALVLFPFAPLPNIEAAPYILASICIHFAYQMFLLKSYQLGDLTQVYPIARGSAPMIVAVVSILFLGEQLSNLQLTAVAIIALGIISLALVRRGDGAVNRTAALAALTTGVMIASYSLVDGHGARLSGTAIGYYAWLTFGNVILMGLYFGVTSPDTLRAIPREGSRVFWIGGTASFLAYVLIIWAFTQAPIALVTALRETSIIFALLIGVFFLKEKLSLLKVVSTMLTLIGAALLRLVR